MLLLVLRPFVPSVRHILIYRLPIKTSMRRPSALNGEIALREIPGLQRGIRGAQRPLSHIVETVVQMALEVMAMGQFAFHGVSEAAETVDLVEHGNGEEPMVGAQSDVVVADGSRPEVLHGCLLSHERIVSALFDGHGYGLQALGEREPSGVITTNISFPAY